MSSTTFPTANFYTLQETPFCGRGVFATKSIPVGTPLLRSDLLPAYVVYREYKREVCAYCFAYDHSRAFKLRISDTGHSFCSKDCIRAWKNEAGEAGLEAWRIVEAFVRSSGSNKGQGNAFDALPDEGARRPAPLEISTAWGEAKVTAAAIRKARGGSKQKMHRKALQSIMSSQAYPDTITFLLSAVLTLSDQGRSDNWSTILELVADKTPYPSPQDLIKHVRSYLHLLAVLPLPMLDHISAETCLALVSRDSHNSFGIRSLDDNGAEMFGFGVWPLASYFNHSCLPNVAKKRVGRAWEFWAAHDIHEGDELCISYMGGDEGELNLSERRGRSEDIWGFSCACVKCVAEEEELEGTIVGSDGS